MNIWRSLAGMVTVELTSAALDTLLNTANAHKIPIFSLCRTDELTASFQITRHDYRKLARLAAQKGESLTLKHRSGLYWSFHSLRKRPVLLAGIVSCILLLLFLPGRILFVQVEGNQTLPTQRILAAAEECGIVFGANRRVVRSERVKNSLLAQLPELEWAGVNTHGCLAVLSVRERKVTNEKEKGHTVSSIVASRDAVIESCTATAGNLLCAPGQIVKKGQILISAYTDCGTHLQACRAEGEIYALTRRSVQAISLRTGLSRQGQTRVEQKYGLILGKKRINLWKGSGISDTTCGRMYEEYYITLPGGFRLPLALTVDTYTFWETEETEFPEIPLGDFAKNSILAQMISGTVLREEAVSVEENAVQHFSGTYVCREMIGRVKPEEIGESYVENN